MLPPERLVCIEAPHLTGKALWEDDPQRFEMRSFMNTLPDPEAAWATFLAFDEAITNTAVGESRNAGIPILSRTPQTTVAELRAAFMALMGLA